MLTSERGRRRLLGWPAALLLFPLLAGLPHAVWAGGTTVAEVLAAGEDSDETEFAGVAATPDPPEVIVIKPAGPDSVGSAWRQFSSGADQAVVKVSVPMEDDGVILTEAPVLGLVAVVAAAVEHNEADAVRLQVQTHGPIRRRPVHCDVLSFAAVVERNKSRSVVQCQVEQVQ